MSGRLAGFLGLLLAAGAFSGVSAESNSPTATFAQALLHGHNRARDEAGVPRLAWSGTLARGAQAWADQLAREGFMRHASQAESGGAGENLWMGSAGHYAPESMIGVFVGEKRHYQPGAFPQVSRTGNWEDVGHYTQVVWRGTRAVVPLQQRLREDCRGARVR